MSSGDGREGRRGVLHCADKRRFVYALPLVSSDPPQTLQEERRDFWGGNLVTRGVENDDVSPGEKIRIGGEGGGERG